MSVGAFMRIWSFRRAYRVVRGYRIGVYVIEEKNETTLLAVVNRSHAFKVVISCVSSHVVTPRAFLGVCRILFYLYVLSPLLF